MWDDETMGFSEDGGCHGRNGFVYTEDDIIRAVKHSICPSTIKWRAKRDRVGDLFQDRML